MWVMLPGDGSYSVDLGAAAGPQPTLLLRRRDDTCAMRAPDLHEGFFAQVSDRWALLANRDIAIGVHDGAQHTGPARNELPLLFSALQLRPLQHRFHYGDIAHGFSV